MKYLLLELLVCPKCRGPELELTSFRTDSQRRTVEVLDGTLACTNCQSVDPMAAGIPRMPGIRPLYRQTGAGAPQQDGYAA